MSIQASSSIREDTRCTRCDKSFPETNPFAFPNRRVSSYVILRVMKMLRNPRMTFSQVADEVGISVSSVSRMLRHWKQEIINSFDRVNEQRISNGPIESVNSRIKVIKQNGNGYRNFERGSNCAFSTL